MTSGIILLAAGSSSRMGTSKQLLRVGEKTLLESSADVANQSKADFIVIVLGAMSERHAVNLRPSRANIIVNEDWEWGIGSSIKAGLTHLLEQSPLQSVLIMVVDQPFVETRHIDTLLQALETQDRSIAASWYDNGPGVPAAFTANHFTDLLALGDNEGAKKILVKNIDSLVAVPFEKGVIDLDTMEDFNRFNNS